MANPIKSVGLCVITLAGLAVGTPVLAQSWDHICSEGEVCKVHGTRPLRYGAKGKFNYGVATETVRCSDDTFGDPAPDVPKECEAYYTDEEKAVFRSVREKDARIRALEKQVQSMTVELDEANEELEQVYRTIRRDQRRERRGGVRIEGFGPIYRERP